MQWLQRCLQPFCVAVPTARQPQRASAAHLDVDEVVAASAGGPQLRHAPLAHHQRRAGLRACSTTGSTAGSTGQQSSSVRACVGVWCVVEGGEAACAVLGQRSRSAAGRRCCRSTCMAQHPLHAANLLPKMVRKAGLPASLLASPPTNTANRGSERKNSTGGKQEESTGRKGRKRPHLPGF
jgi:hypothetical protein